MIIVDKVLSQRQTDGNNLKVAMVGAGAMGRMLALQFETVVPGMDLVAVANRTVEKARDIYLNANVARSSIVEVENLSRLTKVINDGKRAITGDYSLLSQLEEIDVIMEVTGDPEFAANVVYEAINNGKHVVTMNPELQGTIGPILQQYASKNGVIITDSDGDQPGVMMNLFRFVKGLGMRPVLVGNIKGLHDCYRTPSSQEEYARDHGLSTLMATSFADGTKMSFEMSLIANATGLRVGKLGMYGPHADNVQQAKDLFPLDQMLEFGLVDYIVGAEPAPGVFCFGTLVDFENSNRYRRDQMHWLKMYKIGDGPLYTFYTPYHLCHLEAPYTVARVALFGDATVSPDCGHVLDVVALAKRDLKAGEVVDGIGGYMCYGQAENASISVPAQYLPIGVAENCVLLKDVKKDQVLRHSDVELPMGRLIDKLREEQLNLN